MGAAGSSRRPPNLLTPSESPYNTEPFGGVGRGSCQKQVFTALQLWPPRRLLCHSEDKVPREENKSPLGNLPFTSLSARRV